MLKLYFSKSFKVIARMSQNYYFILVYVFTIQIDQFYKLQNASQDGIFLI